MYPSGGLSHLARAQLAAWQDIARGWPLVLTDHIRCDACGQCVIRVTDDSGRPYSYSEEQRLALTVAHLRQAHAGLDPDAGP